MSKFTKQEREILKNVFDLMDNQFTSPTFYHYVREAGMVLKGDGSDSPRIRAYLQNYANINKDGGMIWTKKQPNIDVKYAHPTNTSNLTIESCIQFLKSKGYKVLQPYTEFQEV